jgi:uncharacterized membrane protein
MAFFLIIVGLMMIIVAVRGTQQEFLSTVSDMVLQPQFLQWGLVILMAGLLGYMKSLRSFSITFMTLILLAMVLRNKGVVGQFFTQVEAAIPKPSAI